MIRVSRFMFHGTWPVPIKLITCNFLWVKCLSWRFTYPSIVLTSAAVNFNHSLYLRHWRNDYQNNTKQSHISLHLKDVVSLFHQLVLFFLSFLLPVIIISVIHKNLLMNTVEPRYNDPRYNDIPAITINMLCPGKSYSKMYGTEPRYNDLRYNDIPDITMSF